MKVQSRYFNKIRKLSRKKSVQINIRTELSKLLINWHLSKQLKLEKLSYKSWNMNSKFFNFIFITENNPLTLNRNQLKEFLKYVQRRYHSHFNEKKYCSNRLFIDYRRKLCDYNRIQVKSECNRLKINYINFPHVVDFKSVLFLSKRARACCGG